MPLSSLYYLDVYGNLLFLDTMVSIQFGQTKLALPEGGSCVKGRNLRS
jgi:hypothetical protein